LLSFAIPFLLLFLPDESGVGGLQLFTLTLRAETPVGDFGLVDLKAEILCSGQARRSADCAINIDQLTAASADEVVVVVVHASLKASGGANRLDPTNETC
jgi:hypothetical protein